MLALQRTAGNAATGRLLARTPRKPFQHQWENPALQETIYPARELMLKKFVSIYRELELRDLTDPKARQQVIDETRKAMQAEIDKLKALKDPSKADQTRIGAIEAALKRGQASTEKAFDEAVRWEREHRADPLSGAALLTEVRRLFGTKAVPDWLESMVLDYAGMRYKSAHGSYFSPVRLVFIIERERGTWTKAREAETATAEDAYKKHVAEWEAKDPDPRKRGKAPAKPKPVTQAATERAALTMSPGDAVARLEKMNDAKEIPEWAWHKIVRLTELRTWYAESGWEDTTKEKPPPGADKVWLKVMDEWSGEKQKPLGEHGYGGTAWRKEVKRRNVLLTTRMVCDQLSEVTQLQRGVNLTGGISQNAQTYLTAATEGAKPGAKKSIAGSYFREPKTLADFRPGAALFWVEETKWETRTRDGKPPDESNMVLAIPGARYPLPPTPEYVKEWTDFSKTPEGKKYLAEKKAYKQAKAKWDEAKKQWDVKTAAAKTAEEKAKTDAEKAKAAQARTKLGSAPVEPTAPKDIGEPKFTEPALLPATSQEINGWTYTVEAGKPITRSKGDVTHWLRWKHQATVLKVMPDGRIITFETVVERAGSTEHHVTGFGTRWLKDLTQPGVFIGYMPGEVDAPLATPAPAASDPDDRLLEEIIWDVIVGD